MGVIKSKNYNSLNVSLSKTVAKDLVYQVEMGLDLYWELLFYMEL